MVIMFKRAGSPTPETIEVEELTIRASSNPCGKYDLKVTLETLRTRADTEGVALECTAVGGDIFLQPRGRNCVKVGVG